jgi:phosphatidylglycerol---prolipoprotein diacylglyceryl transferase
MIPYLHLGNFELPTFGLMLWLAAVCAAFVLQRNFKRHGVTADALTIVAAATLAGVLGAKIWHELEHPVDLGNTLASLWHELRVNPRAFVPDFFEFVRAGYAWFGGMVAGIVVLLWMARSAKIKPLTMLDLAAPSAAIGYGVGRIGCHLAGDGDYGIATNLPWGVSYVHGIVATPPGVLVHPTPLYECIYGLALGGYLWWRGGKALPTGRIVGEYLVLAGIGRFLVEFIRINPKVLFGLSNAQFASLGAVAAGAILMYWSGVTKASTTRERRAAKPIVV